MLAFVNSIWDVCVREFSDGDLKAISLTLAPCPPNQGRRHIARLNNSDLLLTPRHSLPEQMLLHEQHSCVKLEVGVRFFAEAVAFVLGHEIPDRTAVGFDSGDHLFGF